MRSTYFNSPAGKRIESQSYFVAMPIEDDKKIRENGKLDDFLLHTYDSVFTRGEGAEIIKAGFDEYYYELDKRKFME